jgi:hypothetical protein
LLRIKDEQDEEIGQAVEQEDADEDEEREEEEDDAE